MSVIGLAECHGGRCLCGCRRPPRSLLDPTNSVRPLCTSHTALRYGGGGEGGTRGRCMACCLAGGARRPRRGLQNEDVVHAPDAVPQRLRPIHEAEADVCARVCLSLCVCVFVCVRGGGGGLLLTAAGEPEPKSRCCPTA